MSHLQYKLISSTRISPLNDLHIYTECPLINLAVVYSIQTLFGSVPLAILRISIISPRLCALLRKSLRANPYLIEKYTDIRSIKQKQTKPTRHLEIVNIT